MSIRGDLLEMIGYSAEVSEPNGQPITAFYTDRHLRPILDRLVEYVEQVRADEREQYRGRRDEMMQALSEELLNVRTKTLADALGKVKALHSRAWGWGKDGHVVLWVNRDDVLDLLDGRADG